MDEPYDDFANRIYLDIELECALCLTRFKELEGETEHEIWQSAKNTAIAARATGWDIVSDRILCPNCIQKQ